MKAAVFYGEHDIRTEDLPMPVAGPGQVLVEVHACGICGTDVHIFHGDEGAAKTPAGTVLGHEFAGKVVAVGEGVKNVKPGDKVTVDPNKLCNECYYCLGGNGHFCENMMGIGTTVHGGFEQYVAVPSSQCYKFPDELSYEKAAMTEPVSCCIHGIDMCEIKAGSSVAVIGAGMIGLLMMQLAKLQGAAKLVVLEPVAEKRQQALDLGADMVIDPLTEDVKAALVKAGIYNLDCVIECVGKTSTIEQAIDIAGNQAVVMMFGLTAPDETISVKPFSIFKKEIVLKSSFINPYTFQRALDMISSGKIDVSSMVYKVEPIEELAAILADPDRRREGKVIIDCTK